MNDILLSLRCFTLNREATHGSASQPFGVSVDTIGVLVAVVALLCSFIVPEVRRIAGLDVPPPPRVEPGPQPPTQNEPQPDQGTINPPTRPPARGEDDNPAPAEVPISGTIPPEKPQMTDQTRIPDQLPLPKTVEPFTLAPSTWTALSVDGGDGSSLVFQDEKTCKFRGPNYSYSYFNGILTLTYNNRDDVLIGNVTLSPDQKTFTLELTHSTFNVNPWQVGRRGPAQSIKFTRTK